MNLPGDGYAEPGTETLSRTTNGSSTKLAVDFEAGTAGFFLLLSLVFLKVIMNIMGTHFLQNLYEMS